MTQEQFNQMEIDMILSEQELNSLFNADYYQQLQEDQPTNSSAESEISDADTGL